MNKEIIKMVVQYINLSPQVVVKYNDESFRKLSSFKDKKMRKSLARAIQKELLVLHSSNDKEVVFYTENNIPTEIKNGMRGDSTSPIFVRRVEFKMDDIETFNATPKEVQRTAKEQADYLFGQLIEQVGGEEWINEQTWIARNKDLIHNNNKGNVAYTRLRLMLKRCYNIYNSFAVANNQKSKHA